MIVTGLVMNAADKWTFHLPPGTWRIVALVPGRAAEYRTVRLNRDHTETIVPSSGLGVTVEVRRNGKPVGDARVTLRMSDGTLLGPASSPIDMLMKPRWWVTDGEGRVELPSVAPGRYAIMVNNEPTDTITVRDTPIEHEVTLR